MTDSDDPDIGDVVGDIIPVSAGDTIMGTCRKSIELAELWYIEKDGGRDYYDVLCHFDKAPKELKVGDKVKGIVDCINIAGDGTPGLFLKELRIITP